ncbi:MAG: ATP-binding protein, partial [Anaerolineales bacterium]|nr:ATP-binding protein [Anaerolineales bacterium]
LLTALLAVHQTEQNGTRTNADERGFNRNASHPMPKNQAQSGESASQNSSPAPKTVSELDLAAVTSRFRLSSGQWRDVARTVQSETDGPITTAALFEAARRHSNPRLGELARKVPLRHGWDDLILPDDQRTALRELLEMVRQRPFVLDTWQLGRKMVASRGISALFSGPPGTGKTMAAAIISRELGLDLYKIDLSTVVSKYIGETEKNLERIFREAETSNAVLFFDEADAIFGKRAEVRDAHDRYANIEVSYLLQRMEAYDGVAILATNLKTNLDEAFLRRLHAIIHFPMPQPRERLQLWEMVRQTAVPQAENLHLPRFAERFELAGGNIRNIIVQAAYLAASNGQLLTTHHLLHATCRELQKMGRLVSEGDWRLEME